MRPPTKAEHDAHVARTGRNYTEPTRPIVLRSSDADKPVGHVRTLAELAEDVPEGDTVRARRKRRAEEKEAARYMTEGAP